MPNNPIESVTTLTFDIFGTVLDLTGSLEAPTGELLKELGSDLTGAEFYPQWRARQRIEQFQDSLIMLGHGGYLETCRRALVYSLRANGIEFDPERIRQFMDVWQYLNPYPDSIQGLHRLSQKYRLVALSNGEPDYLRHPRRQPDKVRLRRRNLGGRGRARSSPTLPFIAPPPESWTLRPPR